MLIGVHGKIHHGKDEIAKYLVSNYGYRILRMSDEIKEEVLKNLRLTLIAIWETKYSATFSLLEKDDQDAALRRLVYVSKPKIVRELLQEYGTEVRRGDDPDYWVKAWSRRALHFKDNADLIQFARTGMVVPDIRYPNEYDTILRYGGKNWKVVRPGMPENNHLSETAMDHVSRWDAVIVNDGSLEDLGRKVEELLTTASREPVSQGSGS